MGPTFEASLKCSQALRRLLIPGVVIGFALLIGACEKPAVSTLGSSATVGGVEFTVPSYELRYLELSEGKNTYEYPRPVLAINVKVKNVGKKPLNYNPTHSSQQMTEASTPLLYQDPGPEADLPPESKTPINGVYLEKGSLDEQVTSGTSLKTGDSITDLFLFEVPDEGVEKLIFSLPPSMHRGKMPVLFRIPYEPKKPRGPRVYSVGDAISFDGAEFTVTGADTSYLKTEDSAQGEGYSNEPLLKISYTIENTSDEPIRYRPEHRAVGSRGAALFSSDTTYKRVKFAATTTVKDQIDKSRDVMPGKSVKDFVVFERPEESVKKLRFEYPASLFESEGLARVEIPYQYEDPDLPKELKEAKKKDEDEDKDG